MSWKDEQKMRKAEEMKKHAEAMGPLMATTLDDNELLEFLRRDKTQDFVVPAPKPPPT
jgi:hypothetical protein